MGDSHVGLQARLMSQALRKLAGTLNRTDTICIFTNQLREKIGVMFGNPETTPGGRALKFYSSVRLDIRRIETLKEGVEAIGNRVRVKVAKNKVAPPFKQAEFDIIYGHGISWEGTVLDAGLERKIVQKSGSYFSFEDERLGQGRQNATAFLREHPDVYAAASSSGSRRRLGDDQVVSARLLPIADPADRRRRRRRRPPRRRPAKTRRRWTGRGAGRGEGRRRGVRRASRRGARPELRAARPPSAAPATAARSAPSTRRRALARATTRLRACERARARRPLRAGAVDALDALERAGYVDDARFARDRAARAGRARLRRRLRSAPISSAQGVDAETVDAALGRLEPERASGRAARRERLGGGRARFARSRAGASPRTRSSRRSPALQSDAARSRIREHHLDVLPAYDTFPNRTESEPLTRADPTTQHATAFRRRSDLS